MHERPPDVGARLIPGHGEGRAHHRKVALSPPLRPIPWFLVMSPPRDFLDSLRPEGILGHGMSYVKCTAEEFSRNHQKLGKFLGQKTLQGAHRYIYACPFNN